MIPTPTDTEPTTERRVFEAWSIEVPAGFAEAFITEEGDYWHAYDEHRSVSMSSVVLTEHGVPVSADRILERVEPLDGSPVEQLPPGLSGRAALCPAPRSSRASRFLSGVLATHGRVLMVTSPVTCLCNGPCVSGCRFALIGHHSTSFTAERRGRAGQRSGALAWPNVSGAGSPRGMAVSTSLTTRTPARRLPAHQGQHQGLKVRQSHVRTALSGARSSAAAARRAAVEALVAAAVADHDAAAVGAAG